MYLSKIDIENYRLLKNVHIDFDKSLTLFVGKNNTGKTSLMNFFEFIMSDKKNLAFDDYPLECRQKLYNAVKAYWDSPAEDAFEVFQRTVPLVKATLTIDYSDEDEFLGALGNFIIDLDDDNNTVIIEVAFYVPPDAEQVLINSKGNYEILIASGDHPSEGLCLASVVQKSFDSLFRVSIATINPSDPSDYLLCSRSDLKNLFFVKTIKAERSLDESEASSENPLGQIMRKLFQSEVDEADEDLNRAIEALQQIITDVNYNVQAKVNCHMDTIVASMTPFGYPDGEDLTLKANTEISLEKRIVDSTALSYVSMDASESLPSSHNGLGYKNLIKISMELHEYARMVKSDRTRIPLLFIEEPEAHMHPQLQTTFVDYLNVFLNREVGENVVQVIMTSHSAHVANTVPFSKVRYIRRYKSFVDYKSLATFPLVGVNDEEKARRLDFLQKYLKLSYCDLYFCDKAILVEGASERLLLPDMISKCNERGFFGEESLATQYYSIIEIGGAYAHLFYDFVDYLGIPTLILTDVDFVNGAGEACQKSEAVRSSNAAINRWCHDVFQIAITSSISLDRVLELANDEEKRTNGTRRIEFQKQEGTFHPRSLEEAIINVNREMFSRSADEIINFRESEKKKTDFAISLLVDPRYENYTIPSYIKDGLIWLGRTSRYADENAEAPLLMHRRSYRRHGEA